MFSVHKFIRILIYFYIWIWSQKQSDEFRLYVYKQLDIQELLELDGVCFMMLLFEVEDKQGYPTLVNSQLRLLHF